MFDELALPNELGHHIATLKEPSRTEGAKRDLTMAIDESTRWLTVATAGDGDVERLAARAEFLAAKNKTCAAEIMVPHCDDRVVAHLGSLP